MLVVLAEIVAAALVVYIVVAEHSYAREPGYCDIGPPLGRAIREVHAGGGVEPLTAQGLLAALKAHGPLDEKPLALKCGEESIGLAAYDVEDEYGRGVLLYYPLSKRGPVWRRPYGLGVIVYEGLERAGNVRLYRYPSKKGFSKTDIGASTHKEAWGFESPIGAATR